jgi:hypothetical protein
MWQFLSLLRLMPHVNARRNLDEYGGGNFAERRGGIHETHPVDEPVDIAEAILLILLCFLCYSLQRGVHVFPDPTVQHVFPLQAAYYRQLLPHVVGSPASEYYVGTSKN